MKWITLTSSARGQLFANLERNLTRSAYVIFAVTEDSLYIYKCMYDSDYKWNHT
jgi:hypothetical protein